jgi:hypothetical protein
VRIVSAIAGSAVFVSILGCGFLEGPPISQQVVDKVASDLCGLGHPNADFVSAEITGWQQGSATVQTHDRYVDIDVQYQRKKSPTPNTMSLRIYLEDAHPCRVSLDVLADDGPNPVLLDNGLASDLVGAEFCDAMSPT